jgi:hypothetical protein
LKELPVLNRYALSWRWSIVLESGEPEELEDPEDPGDDPIKNTIYYESPWFSLQNNPTPIDISWLEEDQDRIWLITITYRDSLGNESIPEEKAKIKYVDIPYEHPVVTWSATYNESSDTITITWTKPTQAVGVLVYVNRNQNPAHVLDSLLSSGTYTITNIPKVNTVVTRDGITVSNSNRYDIELRSYVNDGVIQNRAASPEIFIYNYPRMTTNQDKANQADIHSSGIYEY